MEHHAENGSQQTIQSNYWAVESEIVLQSLGSNVQGISESAAFERLRSARSFALIGNRKSSAARLLLNQFNNPIVLLLIASALLSYFLDDTTNAVIIIVILSLSGLLSFLQERSAADAVAKLLAVIQNQSTVVRDGREVCIPCDQVVIGDIVVLRAGTLVPGDCRIIESQELHVNESALTGESFPVEKSNVLLDSYTPIAKRNNSLFLGTHVVSGSGTAVVVRIGKQTEFGNISQRLTRVAPATGFEQGLRNFGRLLVGITIVLVISMLLINLYFQRPFIDSLMFALALAVGMTPQLLPAITSVVLASGAKEMAKAKVIIKRLLAIENFGGMDILCMDKTGTLTEGTIALNAASDIHGDPSEYVLRLAVINASLQSSFENPIDSALRKDRPDALEGVTKLDELPYDFKRRRLSVLADDNGQTLLISKGAVQNVLDVCTQARLADGQLVDIDQVRAMIQTQFHQWSDRGFRTLAVAYRPRIAGDAIPKALDKSAESSMVFAGFLTLIDPPKLNIAATLTQLRELGISLKLITGDNLAVAQSIAIQVGLPIEHTLTGTQIHSFSDDELRSRASEASLFAEIEPEQKERIVRCLKSASHVVGFLGDGINDAPALHTADVGISVNTAVDVAKDAAQVVLLKSDLSVLIQGVREGRRTLANTLKYVFVSISANFGYMLSMAIASLFIPFLPLLPPQILLINLLADFPAMALASDSVDDELIERPRRWDTKSIFRFMLVFGLTGTCFDMLTFASMLKVLQASPEAFRTVWFMISIITGLLILLAVRTKRMFIRSRPGKLLILAAVGVLFATITLPFSPLGSYFELIRPSAIHLVVVATICTLYGLAMEMGKRLLDA